MIDHLHSTCGLIPRNLFLLHKPSPRAWPSVWKPHGPHQVRSRVAEGDPRWGHARVGSTGQGGEGRSLLAPILPAAIRSSVSWPWLSFQEGWEVRPCRAPGEEAETDAVSRPASDFCVQCGPLGHQQSISLFLTPAEHASPPPRETP